VVVVVVVVGVQFLFSVLRTLPSRVALVKRNVPLEESPPALGVQYFTVSHSSVTVMLPVYPEGQSLVRVSVQVRITSSGGAV
jgi:hypothetical protein